MMHHPLAPFGFRESAACRYALWMRRVNIGAHVALVLLVLASILFLCSLAMHHCIHSDASAPWCLGDESRMTEKTEK